MDKEYKGIRIGIVILLIICTLLVASFSGGFFGYSFAMLANSAVPSYAPQPTNYAPFLNPNQSAPPFGSGDSADIDPDSRVEDIVSAVAPSVVSIYTYTSVGGSLQQLGQGSGVVISREGYIITNYHVIDGSTKIIVNFTDGDELEASIAGSDQRSDLAVLFVKKNDMREIKFADSDDVRVGEPAIAIGNAMGNEGTVTVGVVSATKRYVYNESTYYEMIQTDAAINPGNSGGALVNKRGELIGINAMKLTNTTDLYGQSISIDGMGFAIPVNIVSNIATQLVETGKVTRGGLGIIGAYAKAGTYKDLPNMPTGIYIVEVTPGSAADKAGLKEGMVITKMNGKIITGMGEFSSSLQLRKPGTHVILELATKDNPDKPIYMTVTLEKLSD